MIPYPTTYTKRYGNSELKSVFQIQTLIDGEIDYENY